MRRRHGYASTARSRSAWRLRPGLQSLEVAVAAVEKETEVAVRVEVAGQTTTQTVTLRPVRKWVVYLLPHSHVDIGYTHVQTDVEQAQWKYLEMAIDTAQKSAEYPAGARFKWNVEVLWAVDSYLKQATPEKRQQFIDAVKKGQVGLQALYGNELTGLCRPEELLRLLTCAQQVSQLCGQPITSAMITDVPGYTWGIVPAFAHSGVKYFSIGPNGGDRIGHTIAAWGDKPFWWIGPNGQDKVLVWMTGTGYYQVFHSEERLLEYLGRLADKGYAYDYVQVRHCLGDNGAPDVNFPGAGQAVERAVRVPETGHRHDGRDVPRFRAAVRRPVADGPGRFHALLGRRSGVERAGDGPEPGLGRTAGPGRDAVCACSVRKPTRPAISTRLGGTSCCTTSTPGARTTASASRTIPSSRANGRSSRRSPWTGTNSRGNCWTRRWPPAANPSCRRARSTRSMF